MRIRARQLAALAVARARRFVLPAVFDAVWYARAHPDAAAARGGVALHWLRHGRHEGRMPAPLRAAAVEAELWQGQDAAAALLAALAGPQQREAPGEAAAIPSAAASRARAEVVWARLALARAALAGMDAACSPDGKAQPGQAAARDWLAPIDPLSDLVCLLGMPGPLLLWAEAAQAREDKAGQRAARQALDLARAAYGPFAAWRLMRAGLALQQGDAPGFERHLGPLYARIGLAPPALLPLAPSQGAAFDRLTAAPSATTPVVAGRSQPLVSILMPAGRAAATIDTALAGLVAQGWSRIEVLVLCNSPAGEDETAGPGQEVTRLRAEAWAARDARIRVIDTSDDPGTYPARNRGLAVAAGDLVTCHDADDWSHPDRIARQVAQLLADQSLVAALPFWARMHPDLRPSALRPDVGMIHPCLSGLMIRRTATARAGSWDRVRAGADTEYLARLTRIFGPAAIGRVIPGVPLAFGRISARSLTRAPDTALWGSGAAARATYLAAAAAWHASGADLCLPALPARRPFPVPAALALPLPDLPAPVRRGPDGRIPRPPR